MATTAIPRGGEKAVTMMAGNGPVSCESMTRRPNYEAYSPSATSTAARDFIGHMSGVCGENSALALRSPSVISVAYYNGSVVLKFDRCDNARSGGDIGGSMRMPIDA